MLFQNNWFCYAMLAFLTVSGAFFTRLANQFIPATVISLFGLNRAPRNTPTIST
jgi:hypothetical protein